MAVDVTVDVKKSTKKSTVILMKASISVICYKHKVLANGESPLTHIAQLLPSNSLKFNHPIFQEALSGALQILT